MIPINIGAIDWLNLNNSAGGGMTNFKRNVEASLALSRLHGGDAHGQPCCLEPWELLVLIQAAEQAPAGCFVEVGVYWGGSAHHLLALAKKQQRALYLYDTFEGMPYMDEQDVAGVPVGVLKTSEARVRGLLGRYPTITKGIFPCEPMPPAPIAFAHIDVDAYRSTKETAAALAPLMASGGIMWFDDTNALAGARQAVLDLGYKYEVEPTTNRWYTRF
jgi:hypothetical protein